MTIRTKIILILAVTWAAILSAIYFGFRNAGLKAFDDYLLTTTILGFIIAVMLWYLLDMFFLKRIMDVSKQITDISTTSEFSRRLKISGNDEITNIILAINTMLEIIELTQRQLKYRLFQSSDELEKISLLNTNLSTEIERHKNMQTQLQSQEQELRQKVYSDAVTGLPNRIYFHEYLAKIIQKAQENHLHFAILFLDVDNFKKINDTFGHEIGDLFLKFFSDQLRNYIREGDLVARLAGDEFIIYLNNTNKATINTMCSRIIERTSQAVQINDHTVQSSTSIGISLYPEHGNTLTALQRHADLAMYTSKKQGGNTFTYYGT